MVTQQKGRWAKRVALVLAVLVFYLVTSVPVGLFLYTLKTKAGWDVFSGTGFHAYTSCVNRQLKKAHLE